MVVKNLNPLRLIRISKNIDAVQMSEIFGVSRTYISHVENGIRPDINELVIPGLSKLGITIDEYNELKEFCKHLEVSSLSEEDKYRFALIKALGITSKLVRSETEALLSTYLVPNIVEITSYLTTAQNYDVIDFGSSLLIIAKDDISKNDTCLNDKYVSVKNLGITNEDYQYLNEKFSEVKNKDLENVKQYKLLITLSVLHPKSKEMLQNMAKNYLETSNKVKKKSEN